MFDKQGIKVIPEAGGRDHNMEADTGLMLCLNIAYYLFFLPFSYYEINLN